LKNTWQLQTAKARLSHVVERALRDGPQTITRHGKPAVVVVSAGQYKRLTRKSKIDFKKFLRQASLHDLDLTRNRDTGRDIEF
jgi:prevent-host-death family protein